MLEKIRRINPEIKRGLATSLLGLLLLTGCGGSSVVNGVEIDTASACGTSMELEIPPSAKKIHVFGEVLSVEQAKGSVYVHGLSLDTKSGNVVTMTRNDLDGDREREIIVVTFKGEKTNFKLVCSGSNNTSKSK